MQTDTADRIIEIATDLVRTHGFNAVSFQDVADKVGIRKASLHYHFACKTDLGVALMARYREQAVERLGEPTGPGHRDRLEGLFAVFHAVVAEPDRQCLGGIMAAELGSLPDAIRAEVRRFMVTVESWLARLLADGRAAGAFRFEGDPQAMACTMFAALEGALITARAGDATARMESVVATLRRLVGT